MNKFTQKIIVTKNHLDDLDHVNNVQYLHWAQEIAKSHWSYLIKNINEDFGVWVVRHHDVTYKLAAYLGDKILISTYIKTVKGPISERIVEFHNSKEEKLLVKVISRWCYLNDPKTRKVSHIPNFINKIFKPVYSKVK